MLDRGSAGSSRPGDLVLAVPGRGRARIVRVFGPAKQIEAVLQAVLADEGLREPSEPYEPPAPSLEGRTDLRDLVTFTIDPETAKDFDDAISVVREGDGLVAYVHIADVSHFVPAGSALDRGAAERANSVYVPGLVIPMLPHRLADDLCSLVPYEDRLTLTMEMPFDGGLQPGTPRFYRSVIRSRQRFTYGQVEAILAGRAPPEPAVGEALTLTSELTQELRRRRFGRGALRVESREIEFAFDGGGGVELAWHETEPTAHAMVEELMILTNEAVAELLAARRRPALFRVHETPDPEAVEFLLAKLAGLEVPTPPAPRKGGLAPREAAGLAAAVGERVNDYVQRSGRGREAFPALVLRALKQARYHPQNLGHSGLASGAYCHFTSPIRRYPDLVCHRALLRELGDPDAPEPLGAEELDELAVHTSLRERAATGVEYRADEICLARLLERRLFELGWEASFDGEIIGAIGSGLFVRFGEVFEGYLPARRLEGDYFELDTLGIALVGRRSGRRFRLGDEIGVRVESIGGPAGKVELALAR